MSFLDNELGTSAPLVSKAKIIVSPRDFWCDGLMQTPQKDISCNVVTLFLFCYTV